jgi:copper transport protein
VTSALQLVEPGCEFVLVEPSVFVLLACVVGRFELFAQQLFETVVELDGGVVEMCADNGERFGATCRFGSGGCLVGFVPGRFGVTQSRSCCRRSGCVCCCAGCGERCCCERDEQCAVHGCDGDCAATPVVDAESSAVGTVAFMARGNVLVRFSVGFVLALVVLLSGSSRVSAHATLLASTPGYASTLPQAPTEATFRFDNPVEPGLMKVKLKDEAGNEIGKGVFKGADLLPAAELTFTLPQHGSGKWQLTWTSFAFDGHIVTGVIPYTVDPSTVTPPPGDVSVDQPVDGNSSDSSSQLAGSEPGVVVEVQLRLGLYIALSALVGAFLLCTFAASRRDGSAAVGVLFDQAKGVIVPAAVVAAVLAFGRWSLSLWRLASLDALDQVPRLLWQGTLLLWPLVAALVLTAGLLVHRHRVWAWVLLCAGVLLSAVESHSASASAPGFGVMLAGAHMLAASVWAGGVGVFMYAVTAETWNGIEERWSQVRGVLDRMSVAFVVAFGVLVVSGVRAAFVISNGVPSGRYGSILAVKVVTVAVVSLFGAVHVLLRRRGMTLSRSTLLCETVLLVAVLAAAAVLSATGPVL